MSKQVRLIAAIGTVFVLSAVLVGGSRADTTLLTNLGLLEQLTRGAATDIVSDLELEAGEPIVLVSVTPHQGNSFVKDRLAQALSERGYEVIVSRTPGETMVVEEKPGGNKGRPGQGAGAGNGAGAGAANDEDDEDAAPSEEEPSASGDPVSLAVRALTHAGMDGTVGPRVILDVELLEFGVRYSEVGRKMVLGPVEFTRVGGVYLRVSQLEGTTGFVEAMTTAERHHWDRVSGRERLLAEGASYPFDRPELRAPGLGTYLEPALVVGIVGGLIFLFYENQN